MNPSAENSPVTSDPNALQFRLTAYEGPLDLLLELIRKQQVDIFDIPISQITDEFLAFVEAMELLDLNVGGEWLEMASMLVFIKSKMLLPRPEPDEEEGPDPRDELVQRLLEYQKYRAAADALGDRDLLSRDVFTHPPRTDDYVQMLGPTPLKDASLEDLVRALRQVVQRSKADGTWVYEINSQKLTLRSVMLDLAEQLANVERVPFVMLFGDGELSRHRIITTFLALLEMTRVRMVRLVQTDTLDELYVERAVADIIEATEALEVESES